MSTPFKMKGWSPFTKKTEPKITTEQLNTGNVGLVPGGTEESLIERDKKAEIVETLEKGESQKFKLESTYPGTTWSKVKSKNNPNGVWMTSDGRLRQDM
tara:strand:+ start:185 stop:481 length:297 start_codon:yes stop_codon:yes gene_type:complete